MSRHKAASVAGAGRLDSLTAKARNLAAFRSPSQPVISVYLDVDGRHYRHASDYQLQLDRLLRRAEGKIGNGDLSADMSRIADYVKKGLDRSKVRGLAFFSCSPKGLWEVVELPVPVRNQVVVNQSPDVVQLEQVGENAIRIGMLVADRQRARMLVISLGEIVYRTELFDELPRQEDLGGEWDRDHLHDHRSSAAQHHLRRSAEVAFEVFQRYGFDCLAISAHHEIAKELEGQLHSYLRDRIVARLSVAPGAADEEVRLAANRLADDLERERARRHLGALQQGLGRAKAVAGLDDTLAAVVAGRAEILLVSDGFEAAGWSCEHCGALSTRGPSCPVCAAKMTRVSDVVEEAINAALRTSCRVLSPAGDADLDVLGRIGAILRY